MEPYQYIIIIAVLLIIAFSVVKMNKKDLKLELNKLVDLLGGKENILSTEVEMSRFKVTLKDGSSIEVKENSTILDVAKQISEGLARVATCGEIDGEGIEHSN